jgi:hypothetical protein
MLLRIPNVALVAASAKGAGPGEPSNNAVATISIIVCSNMSALPFVDNICIFY